MTRRLATAATIFLPISFLAGFWGENFKPEAGDPQWVTGIRRGELCGLHIRDVDLGRALVHVVFNYVIRGGQRVRKDTKTHRDRWPSTRSPVR